MTTTKPNNQTKTNIGTVQADIRQAPVDLGPNTDKFNQLLLWLKAVAGADVGAGLIITPTGELKVMVNANDDVDFREADLT